MKKALVIGGSRLIGPNLIETLVRRGYQTVVVNRGTRQLRSEWSDVEQIIGDRNSEQVLSQLAARDFSIVFDTCCYQPQQAQMAATIFNGCIEHYVYVSSVAAYSEPIQLPLTEGFPLGPWDLWGSYGLNKAYTDQAFMEIFQRTGFPVTIVRPTYILGIGNHVEREAFFISRILHNIPIVVPGDGQAPIHFTFADEVATAMVMLAESKETLGQAYNCAIDRSITLVGFVNLCARLADSSVRILCVDPDRFAISNAPYKAADLAPFANVPVLVDNRKLKAAIDITFAPLDSRLSTVVNWYIQNRDNYPIKFRSREREVLAAAGHKELIESYPNC